MENKSHLDECLPTFLSGAVLKGNGRSIGGKRRNKIFLISKYRRQDVTLWT